MGPFSVTVERGGTAESVHRVHAVRVERGEVAEAWGETGLVTFLRSAAKPFQALPLARAAADLPTEELAIACASHEALPRQLAAVEALLERARASESDLECGPVAGSRVRHNCSGKHAGMLLLCRLRGWPTEGYRLPDHPLQQELIEEVSRAADRAAADIPTGTDGCGVVAYALPLVDAARMFGRLGARELDGAEAVVGAMRAHSELVGGPEADDTAVMRALDGAVAKRGAEGVLCVGLADGSGVALKVEDGASRALAPALAEVLGIHALRARPLTNSRGENVGRIVLSGSKSGLAFFHNAS